MGSTPNRPFFSLVIGILKIGFLSFLDRNGSSTRDFNLSYAPNVTTEIGSRSVYCMTKYYENVLRKVKHPVKISVD